MNSVELMQQAVSNWLTVDDVAELSLPHTEALAAALNKATARIWRRAPAHYRRRPYTQRLKASASGTATVTNGQDSISVSISGVTLSATEWQYCTIEIGGVKNQIVNNGLAGDDWAERILHRWTGSSGTYAATIYQDAAFQPLWQHHVDRFVADVVDTITGAVYAPAPNIQEARRNGCGHFFTLSRVRYPDGDGDDFPRSLLEFSTGTAERVIESTAEVMPLPLGVLDASVAKALPYEEEIGGIIADAAGIELVRHPKFRGGDISLASAALGRLADLPQRIHSAPGQIFTPRGW